MSAFFVILVSRGQDEYSGLWKCALDKLGDICFLVSVKLNSYISCVLEDSKNFPDTGNVPKSANASWHVEISEEPGNSVIE